MNKKTFADDPRLILAYFWSVIAAILLFYILIRWGQEKEILTLIIGILGGTVIGGIFGVYFGGQASRKQADQVNVNSNVENKAE
jgi:Mn2+/Fe2+ NRAMP family transporter